MIVQRRTTLVSLVKRSWKSILILLGMVGFFEVLFTSGLGEGERGQMPVDIGGVIITATTIFLAFRVGEAYTRWWEARKLWGTLVNLSRSWCRVVTTLGWRNQDSAETEELERTLVHRHIVYVNALRIRLREHPAYSRASDQYAEFEHLLPGEEIPRYRAAKNVPAYLLHRQGEVVAAHLGTDTAGRIAWQELNKLLSDLTDAQGGCERIKHTTFPDMISFFTKAMIWLLAPLFLAAVMEHKSVIYHPLEVFLAFLVCWAFILMEQLGQDLKNPFETADNDTPMTALCRTIEIDLRQQLGETELPEPREPVDGVLM
jgi:putative membrane protein